MKKPVRLNRAEILHCPFRSDRRVEEEPLLEIVVASLTSQRFARGCQQGTFDKKMIDRLLCVAAQAIWTRHSLDVVSELLHNNGVFHTWIL
jgi:hypothetical protein